MSYKNNKRGSTTSSLQITATVLSIFFINFLPIIGIDESKILMPLIIIQFVLFLLNPLCAFIFCFIINIDLMQNFGATWYSPITVILSFSIFIFNPKLLIPIFINKKLQNVFYFSLLFSFYLIATHFINNSELFGFLIFIPAYYFTINQPKNLFSHLTIIAICFLCIYFFSLIFDLKLFKVGEIHASIESDLTRYGGYDLRQFIIFFIFLIPAFLLTKYVSIIIRNLIIAVGIFAFLILILGIYRLAIFYNSMGLLLSLYLISKFVNTSQLIKKYIYIVLFMFFCLFFFSEYVSEFK